jgi:fermentation-respiration switch protein FrsA (DUF1100 family)
MQRRDVIFTSAGVSCRGWLYVPDAASTERRAAGIVMAHGLSGVKEMDLPRFAERFAAAGFATLLFDYRYFGESDGEPRGQLVPQFQLEDYRNAVSFLRTLPEVDPQRVGIWGTSFSGGHVLHLGAFDRRVRAVVAQVPTVSVYGNAQRIQHPEQLAELERMIGMARDQRYRTGGVQYIPVVAPPGEPCVLPGRSEYERLTRQAGEAPTWRNAITVESLEKMLEYAPAAGMRWIAPTPVLVVVAGLDALTPADLTLDAFREAGEPKSLLWLRCHHHDVYDVPAHFERACGAAVRWFMQHLSVETGAAVEASLA